MSLTQYYTATTLDGFIADPDDSLDWLFTRRQEADGPLTVSYTHLTLPTTPYV